MNITSLAGALWAAGFLEHAALLLVLIVRRRWFAFRFFSAFVAFNVTRTVVLFCTYQYGTPALYFRIYWTASLIDLILQILVILEVLQIVLRPAGVWAEDARKKFRLMVSGGVVPALALSLAIHHQMPRGVGEWIEQGELFAVSLSVILLLAMAASTTALGLVWRPHVFALAVGWAAWNFTGFFVEGAYAYFGPRWHGLYLDNIRILIYQLVTIFWAIMFWRSEPGRGTLAAEQREYLSSLQQQVAGQVKILSSSRKK